MGSGHPVVPLMEKGGSWRVDGSHPVKWPEHSRTFLRLSGERRRKDEWRREESGGGRQTSGSRQTDMDRGSDLREVKASGPEES